MQIHRVPSPGYIIGLSPFMENKYFHDFSFEYSYLPHRTPQLTILLQMKDTYKHLFIVL